MTRVDEPHTNSCRTAGCTCLVEMRGGMCDEQCAQPEESGACPCGHPDCEASEGLAIEQSAFDRHTVAESLEAPTTRLDGDPPSDVR